MRAEESSVLVAALLALASMGCGDDGSTGDTRADMSVSDMGMGDLGPPTDFGAELPEPTSLDGEITCGSQTCGTGQVCVTRFGGVDLGPGSEPSASCTTVPADCGPIYDCAATTTGCCDDAIHACVREICGVPEGCGGFGLPGAEGRQIECGGI